MGLNVDVYTARDGYDCTNKGISSHAKSLCIVNIDGPFEPNDSTPAAMMVEGALNSVRIVPAVMVGNQWKVAPGWWMMGGNYAAISDGRFAGAASRIIGHEFYGAVAIHDRKE